MSKNQTFKITVPITKCYLRKTADGDEKYVIEGMASNTNLDLTGERMAESAIKSMASSLSSHPVKFKNEHGDEWDAEFGEVTALYATDEHELMMEAELDPDHYRTKTLVKALERGRQLGLSIGGYIPEGGAVKEWIAELGRLVKTYTDIILEEISVTGSPAVADTWLTNITKSVKDWKETPMSQDKDLKKSEDAAENKPAEEQQTDNAPEAGDTPETGTESKPEEATKPTDHDNADNPAESEPKEKPSAQEAEPEKNTEAIEPEVPAQKDESEDVATPTEKSGPQSADDKTSEVAKAAVLGSYAEADVVYESINSLSWNLKWYLWDVVVDDDKTPIEFEADRQALFNQHVLIARERIDFQSWYPSTHNPVALIHNIPSIA